MLYILSNKDNEIQELDKLPKPKMVVYIVFSNKAKNKTIINGYRKFCAKNDIPFHVCYFVGEKYEPTLSCIAGIGSMFYKGTVMSL